jgi:hypothetical protein
VKPNVIISKKLNYVAVSIAFNQITAIDIQNIDENESQAG